MSANESSEPCPRRPGRPKDEERAAQRRDEILRAAVGHFARSGFPSADLDALAAELGCAKGTLYRYFPSKRELFAAAADLVIRDLLARLDACEDPDPIVWIERAVHAYLAYFDEHPEYVELLIQERAEFRDRPRSTYFQYREAAAERWGEIYARLMKEGRIRRMPASRPFEVVGYLLYGTIFTNHFAGRPRSAAEQAEDVLDVLLHGLLTPEEIARRERRAGAGKGKSGEDGTEGEGGTTGDDRARGGRRRSDG